MAIFEKTRRRVPAARILWKQLKRALSKNIIEGKGRRKQRQYWDNGEVGHKIVQGICLDR